MHEDVAEGVFGSEAAASSADRFRGVVEGFGDVVVDLVIELGEDAGFVPLQQFDELLHWFQPAVSRFPIPVTRKAIRFIC